MKDLGDPRAAVSLYSVGLTDSFRGERMSSSELLRVLATLAMMSFLMVMSLSMLLVEGLRGTMSALFSSRPDTKLTGIVRV